MDMLSKEIKWTHKMPQRKITKIENKNKHHIRKTVLNMVSIKSSMTIILNIFIFLNMNVGGQEQ